MLALERALPTSSESWLPTERLALSELVGDDGVFVRRLGVGPPPLGVGRYPCLAERLEEPTLALLLLI